MNNTIQGITAEELIGSLVVEDFYFGVNGDVQTHRVEILSDESVGHIISNYEGLANLGEGITYRTEWVKATCVHMVFDRQGHIWLMAIADLVTP